MSSGSLFARLRTEVTDLVRGLATIGPSHGPRWPLALQAALAMAVPVLALAALGHGEIALLAATGAFPVIYGGWLRPRERARFAPLVGLALLGCAALGTVAAAGGTGVVLAAALVITVASAAGVGWLSLGPPGPVFFVLVFGLSAQVTAVRDGIRSVDPVLYLAVAAGATAFACLVVAAPLVLPRYRREPARPLRTLFPARWGGLAQTLALRGAVVGVVGVAAAAFVDPERSYWIIAAGLAVVGMPLGRRAAAQRGIHRTLGTVVGAGVFLALAFVPLPVWALALLLGALQFVIEMVVVRHYGLALVFITPLVLLIIGAATGETATVPLALERVVDTLVGAAVGTAAAFAISLRED